MATTKKEIKTITSPSKASLVLKNPRITEKAARASKYNIYVFNVAVDATKSEISKAFTAAYKHTPVKINTVPMSGKKVFRRGAFGTTNNGKKAYITLKKGDTIQIM